VSSRLATSSSLAPAKSSSMQSACEHTDTRTNWSLFCSPGVVLSGNNRFKAVSGPSRFCILMLKPAFS